MLSPEEKKQFELKDLAESIFKDTKKTIPNFFTNERLGEHKTSVNNFTKSPQFGEKVIYATECMKYDRRGYKPRERILIFGDKSLFLLDAKTYKQKHRISLNKIPNIVMTKERDGLLVIRIPLELKKDKGDLILNIPQHSIECAIWFIEASNKKNSIEIVEGASFSHNMLSGKSGTIQVDLAANSASITRTTIHRARSGNLLVVSWEYWEAGGFVTLSLKKGSFTYLISHNALMGGMIDKALHESGNQNQQNSLKIVIL